MSGEVWIKEAERLTPSGNHNAMSGIGGPRATLHCTVSNPGSFDAMVRVLKSKTSESHLLYDGKTDRLGQFFPLDRAARALARGTLDYSHNRVGSVNIQIEVCNMPVDWTASGDWNPGPNFRAMIRAIRSWGIKDEFVYRPAKTGSDRGNVVRPDRLLTSSEGGGKWWGHCHYGQGESHWDPGPLNLTRFFGAAPVTATTAKDLDMTKDELIAVLTSDAFVQKFATQLFTGVAICKNPANPTGDRVTLSAVVELAASQAIVAASEAGNSLLTPEQAKAMFAEALSGLTANVALKPGV